MDMRRSRPECVLRYVDRVSRIRRIEGAIAGIQPGTFDCRSYVIDVAAGVGFQEIGGVVLWRIAWHDLINLRFRLGEVAAMRRYNGRYVGARAEANLRKTFAELWTLDLRYVVPAHKIGHLVGPHEIAAGSDIVLEPHEWKRILREL
jgi:hypothetical protein